MKCTVDGTLYIATRENAEVDIEADDERQAAEKAQKLAYARELTWDHEGTFRPTYKGRIDEDGDHVFDVDEFGEMREGD